MPVTRFWWGEEVPKGWTVIRSWGDGFALSFGGLRAIIDCGEKSDGQMWLHLSVSRADWAPSHADMKMAKAAFMGDRYAYQVWPPKDKYVNIHPYCLHLWARLHGEPVLPEFSEVVDGVGRSI